MGQRPSIQTPASEVARRPRTNSDLAATADNSTNLRGGYRDSIGHRIHRERQNGISSGTSSNQTRSRYHQQESVSLPYFANTYTFLHYRLLQHLHHQPLIQPTRTIEAKKMPLVME